MIKKFIEVVNSSQQKFPITFSKAELVHLIGSKLISLLEKHNIVQQSNVLHSILCPECQTHYSAISIQNNLAIGYCIQEDSDRFEVSIDEALMYKLNFDLYLKFLCKQCKIKPSITCISENLWYLGIIKVKNINYNIYYAREADILNNLDKLKKPSIVFIEGEQASNNQICYINIQNIISTKLKPLLFDNKLFTHELLSQIETISFNYKNGDFYLDNRIIFNVTPSTPEYWFIVFLYENLNRPVSYDDIYHFICEKRDKDYDTKRSTYCQKLKNIIKEQYSNIDIIIKPTQTPEGIKAYIMRTPEK